MTIRAKLYAAIVVSIAGLGLTIGVGIWEMSRLGERFDQVLRAADAQRLAFQLKFGVTDFNGWQTAYGYDAGASRPRFLSSVDEFRTTLARAHRELTSRGERALLSRVDAAFADFMRLDGRAFAALHAGRKEEVRRLFLGPEIVNFQRAAAAAEQLAQLEDARAASAERGFKDDRSDGIRLLIGAGLVAALLVGLLLFTALDLVRSAERALQSAPARPPE
jgi:methyl-accepting chemotaxis protein